MIADARPRRYLPACFDLGPARMALCAAAILILAGGLMNRSAIAGKNLSLSRTDVAVVVRDGQGRVLLEYRLKPPAGHPTLQSGGYFHPVTTPSGRVITDLAPDDHRHHRGVFLAFVEMHGRKSADFWGWGAHAPTQDRRIVNREVRELPAGRDGSVSFLARNEWLAEDVPLLGEELEATLRAEAGAHILDLNYRLTPDADLRLSRWAFSGFCVRAVKEGEVTAFSRAGIVDLPNPKHTDPSTDWPDADWYGYSIDTGSAGQMGVVVIDHPSNPPALWHNHRGIRMLNPAIVAPREVELKAGEPLRLRYRVVTFDGPVPEALLKGLAGEF